MPFRYLIALVLLVAGNHGVNAQPCTRAALDAYIRCVAENPCECANCDDDPSDDVPVLQITAPDTCQDITRVFCPLVRCCSICEDIANTFYTCSADTLANDFVGADCPLTCAGFNFDDVNCEPTQGPTFSPTKAPTDTTAVPTFAPTEANPAAPNGMTPTPPAGAPSAPTPSPTPSGTGSYDRLLPAVMSILSAWVVLR